MLEEFVCHAIPHPGLGEFAQGEWTPWQAFPDPREGQFLNAPFGPGVYELRHAQTGELILVGESGNCANRMSTLLPKPFGVAGNRKNSAKRDYTLANLSNLEYRCLACKSKADAKAVEGELLKKKNYRFPT